MKKILTLIISILTCLAIATFATACFEETPPVDSTTITFNSDGGSSLAQKTIEKGATYTLEVPTKTGYDFGGWYDGTTLVESSGTWSMTKTAVTLKAKWTAKTYTLTLDLNGGTIDGENTVTVTYGEQIPALPTPSKVGCDFAGWKLDSSDFDVTANWSYAENKTIVANYQIKKFSVTLNYDNGEPNETIQNKEYNTLISSLLPVENPTRTGYTFDKWVYANGDEIGADDILTQNVELKALWTVNTYSVTLNYDNGEPNGTIEDKEYNTLISSLLPVENPTKTGYTFAKWVYANGSDIGANDKLTQNVELKAEWTANTYTLTLDLNGGTIAGENTVTVTYGEQIPTLPTPNKFGNNFAGWKLNGQDFNVEAVWTYTEGKTIVASYILKQYNLTLNYDNGEQNDVLENKDFGTLIKDLLPSENPTKTGYTFAKWVYASNNSEVGNNDTLNGNIEIKADWNANLYDLTLDVGDGEIDGETTIKVVYGQVPEIPTPTKEGHNFAGWKLDGVDFDTQAVWNYTENKTIVAEYTTEKYSVTLNFDNGTENQVIENIDYGTKVQNCLPQENPTKSYFNFNKWVYAINGNDIGANDILSGDVELKATWNAVEYTITVDENGGEQVEDLTYTIESQNITLPVTQKEGYDFKGWYGVKNVGGTNYYVGKDYFDYLFENGSENVSLAKTSLDNLDSTNAVTVIDSENFVKYIQNGTLIAKWSAKTYTLTLDLDGGEIEGSNEITVTFGEQIPALPTPTKDGYDAVGWTFGGQDFDVNAVWNYTENKTIVVKWTEKSYKIIVKLSAGEVLYNGGDKVAACNDGDTEYEIEVVLNNAYDISNYTITIGTDRYDFVNFVIVDGDENADNDVEFAISGTWTSKDNVTIKAVWKENSSWTGNH